MTARILVEACVDAIDAALEAERGGAARIELCGELLQGGVTPSAGLIGAVRQKLRIPLFVLVRPRTGDFLYSDDELDVMRRDIEAAKTLGAHGVVLGALTPDGDVDAARLRSLVALARPMQVTFHRAFDFARELGTALDALMALGVDRVLTSGGAATALEGAASLAQLVKRAGDQLTVLAGGSITASNVGAVVKQSGVREVHVRGAEQTRSAMRHRHHAATLVRPQSPSDDTRMVTSETEIRRIIAQVK